MPRTSRRSGFRSRLHVLDVGHLRGPLRRVHGWWPWRCRRPAADGQRHRARARCRPALQHGNHASPRPTPARQAQIRVPTSVRPAMSCSGSGAQAGLQALRPARTCGGQGAVRASAGLLHRSSAPVPPARVSGQTIDDPCQHLRMARAALTKRAHARRCPYSGGRRGRHAHSGSPARARRACAAGSAGDLYIFLSVQARTSSSSATAPTSSASVPVSMIDGGARRRRRSADHRRQEGARMPVPVRRPRPASSSGLKSKGMPVLRSKVMGDMYIQVDGRDAGQPVAQAA
jgi:molecular chaperone DnaJ